LQESGLRTWSRTRRKIKTRSLLSRFYARPMVRRVALFEHERSNLTGLAVIRLKQVEHVRNERNVLAAVAGHPFITTMVASFQDQDSLYMLVNSFPRPYWRHANLLSPLHSWITAPVVRFLAICAAPAVSTSPRHSSTPPKSSLSSNSCTTTKVSHIAISNPRTF
jgi:hypothetical protein